MIAIVSILIFVVVAAAVFLIASALDQRSAQARLLRDRLASVQQSAARAPSEELALLRDEMLSKIPALDTLLRRSERITNLQEFLEQANLKIRAGNILFLCALSSIAFGGAGLLLAGASFPANQTALFGVVGWCSAPSCPIRTLPIAAPSASPSSKRSSPKRLTPWPVRSAPDMHLPLLWNSSPAKFPNPSQGNSANFLKSKNLVCPSATPS